MTILAPAPGSRPRPSRRVGTSSARRGVLYVAGLLSVLPLLAFTLAAARALGLLTIGVGVLLVSR
jgi:EamA domain-containing membrane protein RarD